MRKAMLAVFFGWAVAVVLALSPVVARAQAINNYPPDVQQKLREKVDLFSSGARAFFFGPSSTKTVPATSGCIPGQALGTNPACTGTNTQVDNPSEDGVSAGGVSVTFPGQSETTIAVSGSNLLAAWNDAVGFFVQSKGLSGVAFSTNGGQTWCDAGGFFNLDLTNEPFGDNTAVADSNANFFTAYLYESVQTGFTGVPPAPMIAVSQVTSTSLANRGCPSNIAGENNIGGVPVIAAVSATDFLDKPWLAIDPNPQPTGANAKQAMYMCYARFLGTVVGDGQIEVIRSLDGGQTWSLLPVVVQPDQTLDSVVNQGCYVTVRPSHQVYVVWEHGWLLNGNNDPNGDTPSILFSRSLDFGNTFSPPTTIATFHSLAQRTPNGYNRGTINDFPKIDVDRSPFSAKFGSLYVAWQAAPAIRSPLADILVAISRDGGNTWQAPIVVNSDTPGTNLHFMPSISTDSYGNVNVIFYDRRLNPFTPSPFNSSTTGSDPNDSGITNLFAAQIPVIGAKIVNWKITDMASAWLTSVSDIIPNFGDYLQGVSVGSILYSLWADSRNQNVPSPFFATSNTKAIASTTK